MPDEINVLLINETAAEKLGARGISWRLQDLGDEGRKVVSVQRFVGGGGRIEGG